MDYAMNKVLPFVLAIAFWGLFYIGNTYPGAGETIAIVAVIAFIMLILYNIKIYLLNIVLKNK
jgi:hypothetical protein